ncbi:Hypothetical predicted protein [Scomber scombrus]|uniref:Uncharacterized protein n=1 Tax=Scomber scombrus TaxID=13677 RepID=A0AAV1NU35_SCOSC
MPGRLLPLDRQNDLLKLNQAKSFDTRSTRFLSSKRVNLSLSFPPHGLRQPQLHGPLVRAGGLFPSPELCRWMLGVAAMVMDLRPFSRTTRLTFNRGTPLYTLAQSV